MFPYVFEKSIKTAVVRSFIKNSFSSFYLVNTRMRSKRDIKMGRLCTRGGGGGGSPRNCRWGVTFCFLNGYAIPDKNMLFFVRLYALVVLLKTLPDFRL